MIKNLTDGKVTTTVWGFTLPMFISVIFQQLYNLADSAIAGRYAGEEALAAVGVSYPITMIYMAIAIGSNIGCAVVISRYFGANQWRKMKTAIFTTLIASTVVSVVLMVIGFLTSSILLDILQTPDDIFSSGLCYLNIYIGGLLFLFLYNVATGIFNSLGDSKTPLYFLIGSSIGNIILDYVFVSICHWGVSGVAWATFCAQGVACILSLIVLYRRISALDTGKAKIMLYSHSMFKRICVIAVPSILQQSFVSIGNLFIQSKINSYGAGVLAGYSAAVKLNNFAITSFSTVGNAISSFTAQNLGAGKINRVKEGYRAGVIMAGGIGAIFILVYLLAGKQVMSIFLTDDSGEAMATGILYLRVLAPFYLFVEAKLVADGVLRGGGAIKSFMATTFVDLILRVILAFIFSIWWGSLGIWIAWPVGWLAATALSIGFYLRGNWKRY